MKIVESFLAPKTGQTQNMEDEIVVTDDFAAVLDGCTRQPATCWDGNAPGRVAVQQLSAAIRALPATASLVGTVEKLSDSLADLYRQRDLVDELTRYPQKRAAATAVIYSRRWREIWMVGDCQCRIGRYVHQPRMRLDDLLSELRSMEIYRALLSGRTEQDILTDDVGRQAISQFQRRQCEFQNIDVDCPFGYGVIDGFRVPERYHHVHQVPPDITEVVLGSDGYPRLEATLAESEQALATMLDQDPLLFRLFKATKGKSLENLSFDDRAYLRLDLD